MQFSRDALQLLLGTAQEAKAMRILQVPGDGRTAYVDNHGVLVEIPVKPPVREHAVFSIEDLIVYAGNVAELQKEAPPCTVWHSDAGVVLILNDSDRRDRVVFALNHSNQFKAMQALEAKRPSMTQTEFIRVLRLELFVPEATIAIFRKLDWKNSVEQHGEKLRNRESLGKSVESQVLGTAEIPDSLTISLPVYCNLGQDREYSIRCLVELDAINARIQLVPEAGELDRAVDTHQAFLRGVLESSLQDDGGPTVPIYYGNP
jgi:hypothetical protein